MSDLYHIPGDNGKDYRLKKFVEYQHEVPATDYRFVAEYCRRNSLSKDKIVDLAFILSVTYSEVTTIFINELLRLGKTHWDIWDMKENLNFGSAGKYKKYNDEYIPIMESWDAITGGQAYKWILKENNDNPEITYRRIHRKAGAITGVGRFTIDQFLLMICYMKDDLDINIQEPAKLDWKHCSNQTSGIFNIFYEDERANEYDRTKKVSQQDIVYLTAKLKVIQKEIQSKYPEQDSSISGFVDKICSFRNLFKASRYGGFHHDRELGVIKEYETLYPEYGYIWEECYRIREDIFPDRLLGEKHGWNGIRKERKKLWLTTGKTGVEYE